MSPDLVKVLLEYVHSVCHLIWGGFFPDFVIAYPKIGQKIVGQFFGVVLVALFG